MVKIRMKNTLHKSILLLLGVSTLVFSQSSFSDATVTYEQASGMEKIDNTMQIKDGIIRFTPPNNSTNYSLYDSKTSALTHVDTIQKKYLYMDEAFMAEQAKKVKQQMDMMRQQMMAKMAGMPPEQKKQMEQMMNNHLPQTDSQNPAQKVEPKKTSRTETIAGIECTVYESYLKGSKINEICMVDADKLGLSSQDAETMMSMQKFMKRVQKVSQNMMGSNTSDVDLSGIPLHTKLFASDGSVKMETRLVSISKNTIGSDKISIPADFTAMEMPQIPGMQ